MKNTIREQFDFQRQEQRNRFKLECYLNKLLTLICAELAGDFHLGYARQLTDKSSLLFDLAF